MCRCLLSVYGYIINILARIPQRQTQQDEVLKCFRKIVIWMYEVVGDALQESKRESLVKVDDNLLYNICLEESDYSGLCIIPHYGFHYLLWFIHYS